LELLRFLQVVESAIASNDAVKHSRIDPSEALVPILSVDNRCYFREVRPSGRPDVALNRRPTILAHQSVIGGKPDLSKTPQNRRE